MPFRQFIKFNRTIIKVTHVPILLLIYVYEKLRLARFSYEPDELIEQHGRRTTLIPFALNGPPDLFSPGTRLREPSITAFQKDRALDEVFRRPFDGDVTLTKSQNENTDQHSNVVDKWMHGLNDGASAPEEQPRSILERLERARPVARRAATYGSARGKQKAWRSASQTGSVKSDPEDNYMRSIRRRPQPIREEDEHAYVETHVTDRDADDELLTTDHEDETNDLSMTSELRPADEGNVKEMHEEDLATPTDSKNHARFPLELGPDTKAQAQMENTKPKSDRGLQADTVRRAGHHRNSSTTTILFNPQSERSETSSLSPRRPQRNNLEPNRPRPLTRGNSMRAPPVPLPRRVNNIPATRSRPGLPSRNGLQSTPNVARFLNLAAATDRRAPSFEAFALDLASDIGDNRNVVLNDDTPFLSSSYQPGMNQEASRRNRRSEEESVQMSRIVLARMNALEDGFKDMLREVKALGSVVGSATASSRGNSANETEGSQSPRKIAKKMGAGASAKAHKSVVSVQTLDGAAELEKRRGSGLREVESVEDAVTATSDVAITTKTADLAQEERPSNKTSNSF